MGLRIYVCIQFTGNRLVKAFRCTSAMNYCELYEDVNNLMGSNMTSPAVDVDERYTRVVLYFTKIVLVISRLQWGNKIQRSYKSNI